jgi:ketosteroid isomerase-like protein
MAESTSVVEPSAIPAEDLKRAEKFTLEPYVHEDEDPAVVLAPGTPRRRALDEALAEIDAGLKEPSVAWRQHYSLMLGLERLVAQEEPTLVDGTVLSAHQVDALSGTLTALLAEAQRNGNGSGNGHLAAEDVVALAPDGSVGLSGREAWKHAIAGEPFRDERITVEDMLVDGDKVCVRYTLTCTHESGREIRTSGTKIYTVREGKITTIAGHDDVLGVLRQLGITEIDG